MLVSATGPASAAAVWTRYVSPGIWPSWAPHIHAADYPHQTVRPATKGQLRGPGGVRLDFRVDAVDEAASRWSWTVSRRVPMSRLGFPARVRMDHGVEPHAGGSRAWVQIHLPAPVAGLYAPIARFALSRLVARTPPG
jgi:hypothetical protein